MTATQAQPNFSTKRETLPDFSVRRETLFWLLFVAAVFGIFWPGLIRSEIPAFRDAYHFYFPQAHWQIECARQGEWFPMWNRFEGLGTSVPGQGSSALYYPLRLLLLLPALGAGISAAQAFSIFLASHIVIAAIGIRLAASTIAQSQAGCWIAGLSFALSCPVFFQQYNQIYLCSAVWMGFTLAALLQLERRASPIRQSGWACLWSFSIAAMLLAGDPHSAVNSVLVSSALAIMLSWRSRDAATGARLATWISVGCLVAALVTIPQWLPTLRWSQHCHRAGVSQIWPAFKSESSNTPGAGDNTPLVSEQTWLRSQLDQSELSDPSVYEFSLSPWHVASIALPTIGGQYLPTHSRWLDAWPAEGRMWVPSLFMGSATFLTLLLIAGKQRREFLFLGIFCLILSFGNYSPSWLLREASMAVGAENLANSLPSDRSTALYEGLVQMIPGYSGFRYPAKWTTWFVAMLCLFTSANIHQFAQRKSKPRKFLALVVVAAGLSCLVFAALLMTSSWQQWFNRLQPLDPLLGRCNATATSLTLLLAGSSAIAALAAWTFAASRKRFGLNVIAGYTLLELSCLAFLTSCFTSPPNLEESLSAQQPNTSLVWTNLRYANVENQPTDLSLVERQSRLQDQFMIGKLSSLVQTRSLAAVQTLEPAYAEKLRLNLNNLDDFSASQPELDALLAMLGVTHRLAKNSQDPKQLAWITVDNPKPICELITPAGSDDASDTLSWSWASQSCLELTIDVAAPSTLLIRQFNDGGWIAEPYDAPDQVTRVEAVRDVYSVTSPAPTPFIEIQIPSGRHLLTIRRRWLW